jgi:hypothetical protein
MQSQPPPKGSLEDLFRHHLLESEAAAVPPRALVWEHIDNSLLLAQNEKYRRRLLVHRWGMAASLLLATLAGGGWWHSQQVATATLASANARNEAARRAITGAVAPGSLTNTNSTASETNALATAASLPVAGTTGSAATGAAQTSAGLAQAGRQAATSLTANSPALAQSPTHDWLATGGAGQAPKAGRFAAAGLTGRSPAGSSAGTLAYGAPAGVARDTYQAEGATAARPHTFSSPNAYTIAATSTSPSAETANASLTAKGLSTSAEPAQSELATADNTLAVAAAASRSGEDLLSSRLVALALAAPAGPPTGLVARELPPPVPTQLRRWRYGAEYAITAFQPNIDFNRSSSDYNPALGLNTISLTRAAAAEYRANLRPGLGQRLTLRATRWLGGHWSLSTGVAVAQQDAYSATSAAFTGEQLADASSFNTSIGTSPGSLSSGAYPSRDLHESSFRYRSAGVPIELQYDNQAKSGVSFYGRIGAIVSALLSAHSEVAGNAEATRTYTAFSASSPYRRLTALLRGSAGVRYRPAGRGWGLNVGPTAEAGVQSLNTETDRSFLQQRRPYSVGIEAGFEFGGSLKPVPASN